MTRHGWSGYWPTEEYPPKGATIRYRTSRGQEGEGVITMIWCGIEPVIVLDSGISIFPTLDEYEVVAKEDP